MTKQNSSSDDTAEARRPPSTRVLMAACFKEGEFCFAEAEFDTDGDTIAAFADSSYQSEGPGIRLVVDQGLQRPAVIRVLEKFLQMLKGKQGNQILKLEGAVQAIRRSTGRVELIDLDGEEYDDGPVYTKWTPSGL